VSLRSQSRIEAFGGSSHGLEIDRWSRKSGIAGDNGAGHGNELFSGLSLESVRNPDALYSSISCE
jgi:hypothetical protein